MVGVIVTQFWIELLQRSLKATLEDLGTSGLGWLVCFGVPALVAAISAAQAERGKRLESLRTKWRADVRTTLLVYVVITFLVGGYEILWGVPHAIYRMADSSLDPSTYISKADFLNPNLALQAHSKVKIGKSISTTVSDIPLSVAIVNPSQPAILVENLSDKLAENITWELVMIRLRDQAFFSFSTQNIGYVKAHSKSAPYSMELNSISKAPSPGADMVRDGDDFIGSVAIDCPYCVGVTLAVSFKWGHSGWFIQLPDGNGRLLTPRDMTNEKVTEFINILGSLEPQNRSMIEQLRR